MAQIGDMKYCELDVEEAIEAAEILVNDFGGNVGSEEAWAQALGHSSSNSGTYYTKVADLRRFGLIPSRGIEATELAHRVANPRNEQEEAEAVFDMLNEVPLLSEVYESLNGGEPPEEFWRVLVEITDTNPKEAREAAEPVRKQYRQMKEADRAMKQEVEDEEEKGTSEASVKSEPEVSSQDSPIYIKVGDDELRLSEINDAYIGIAQDFLERLKSGESFSSQNEEEEKFEQRKLSE